MDIDIDTTEVHAYGMGLESISAVVGLQSFTNLRSLSLHGNHISVIEGLEALHHLENLNLSSNRIRKVEGISHLSQLKVLDLSSNFIEEIRGFQGLTSLVRLVLAHNRIEKLRGLAIQDGPGYVNQCSGIWQYLLGMNRVIAYMLYEKCSFM
jgi:Leucine-rich repeat (LRR) protein